MLDRGIAERYAKALMAVATSPEVMDQYDDELDSIIEFDKHDPTLVKFLAHPKIEAAHKKVDRIRRFLSGEALIDIARSERKGQ